MATDTSERGLDRLICTALAGHPCGPPAAGAVAEPTVGYWDVQGRQPLVLDENGPTQR